MSAKSHLHDFAKVRLGNHRRLPGSKHSGHGAFQIFVAFFALFQSAYGNMLARRSAVHGRLVTSLGDDDRDVRGPMLGARIGDLMCCVPRNSGGDAS
jgi:hypothetical protein